MNTTSVSLLERLQKSDAAAWSRFADLYTPLLYYWAKRFGLQESDAADLVQEVFTILVKEMPRFLYRPNQRFRGWLWTLMLNKRRERERRKGIAVPLGSDGDWSDESGADPVAQFDEAEYRRYVVDRALQLMQVEFPPHTWKACWEYVVADRPAAEVALELGISVNAVHVAKSRVLRRLREELNGLLDD
jgi:RNA polymerase sigma-70 factor (ECF subfamily)